MTTDQEISSAGTEPVEALLIPFSLSLFLGSQMVGKAKSVGAKTESITGLKINSSAWPVISPPVGQFP